MCKLTRIAKQHNAQNGKRGFTLVELTVVMALMAILATMIVTFSSLMSDFAAKEQAEYDFLEDVSILKESLSNWIAENDVTGAIFTLTRKSGETETYSRINYDTNVVGDEISNNAVMLNGDILSLSGKSPTVLDEIAFITFECVGTNLLKCTAYHYVDGQETPEEVSFVVALRCATVDVVVEGGAE